MSCTHFLHRCVDDISRIRASVLIPLSLIGGFKNNHFAQQAMLQEPSRIFKLWQTVWSAWSFMDRCLEVLTRTRAASAVKKNRQIFNVWIRTGGALLWNMFSQWGPSILMYSTVITQHLVKFWNSPFPQVSFAASFHGKPSQILLMNWSVRLGSPRTPRCVDALPTFRTPATHAVPPRAGNHCANGMNGQ